MERPKSLDQLHHLVAIRLNPELLRFVLQNETIPGELRVGFILRGRAGDHVLQEIEHAELASEREEAGAALRFGDRHRAAVDPPELVLAHRADL